jgi:ABC-type proline/glycine betaine transport system permease subunit
MGLAPRGVLDVVELVFYIPALGLSIWILVKHGFGRQLGWIYLAILSLVRIVGASTGLASVNNHSAGLTQASVVCAGIGLSPLLLAMVGIIKRVNEGMQSKGVPPRIVDSVSIPILVGLILGIVGSTKAFNSDPTVRASSAGYTKAAVILYILVVVVLSYITITNFKNQRYILDGEKRLMLAALASIPFLAVRFIYTILSTFDKSNTIFNSTSNSQKSVVVQAIMGTTMEFIVVIIYLAAGILTKRIPRSLVRQCHVDQGRDARLSAQGSSHYNKDYSSPAMQEQHVVLNENAQTPYQV